MNKNVLLTTIVLILGMCLNAQTVIFEDDFESYADGTNLTSAGYAVWEGTAKVDSVEGNKFGVSDVSKNNFSFRKSITLEAGKTYTWRIRTKANNGAKHFAQVNPTNTYTKKECTNADWETHLQTFTVVEGEENVILSINRWPKQVVSFDDFLLVEGENIPTSINNLTLGVIKIFPNPSEGVFKISNETAISSYRVFNAVGQLVQGRSVLFVKEVSVDLSQEKKGLYMLQVTDESGTTQTSKVIIK